MEEFEYISTASSNADAGILAFITEGTSVYMKTSAHICALMGFENTDTIHLDQFLSMVKKEDVLVVQRQINRFISGESDALYVEVSVKTSLGIYHTFTLECILREACNSAWWEILWLGVLASFLFFAPE